MSENDSPVWKVGGENGNANSLEVHHYSGGFNFEVENPWAGDSETGFGQSTSIRLTAEQAQELGRWLLARSEPQPTGGQRGE